MIQFNLLPDVKLAFIKASRRKRLVTAAATLVTVTCLTVLVLLFSTVNVLQKRHLTNLSTDITAKAASLQATPNLNKILTVQNQLQDLTGLHDQKPVASRLFRYMTQMTPSGISLTKVEVDFELSTLEFTGTSGSLNDVNKFVDTLKFTEFKASEQSGQQKAFANVVLTSFGRNDQAANFSIDVSFDPLIFNSAQNLKLIVPDAITTRSETEKPLFDAGTGSGN